MEFVQLVISVITVLVILGLLLIHVYKQGGEAKADEVHWLRKQNAELRDDNLELSKQLRQLGSGTQVRGLLGGASIVFADDYEVRRKRKARALGTGSVQP